MSSEVVIGVKNMGKSYHIYNQPRDRLKQFLFRGKRQYFREFWALKDVNLDIEQGEVLGIIGRNGAGKSTLLQLLCGTLAPTHGEVMVKGRVAALLELGAGFNPEFTGRENVFMSAAILGLSKQEIESKFNEIVDFSGIRDFIDQPVNTYSSGMYVRLAFSVATSVNPNILIIDEALSVGDGEFSRKSFDRIREMKEAGKTILFCSHSLYQVESFCDRVLWLDKGRIKSLGVPAEVVRSYSDYLKISDQEITPPDLSIVQPNGDAVIKGHARLSDITISLEGQSGKVFKIDRKNRDLRVKIQFESDPQLEPPTVGVAINYGTLLTVADATYGTAAMAYNVAVDASLNYSLVSTNTAIIDSGVAASGQIFTLTTGADIFTGTTGDDTFTASEVAGTLSWSVADTLDGGAGSDTLSIDSLETINQWLSV